MLTDPIGDMLTRIRNALKARKRVVLIPGSRLKLELVRILKEEGYLEDYRILEEKPQKKIEVVLKYDEKKNPIIAGLRRVSKPGRRIYRGYKELPKVLDGLGIAIISTSQGIMTDYEARKRHLGGEVICEIW